MKIAWICLECNWLQVSDSKEHHQMDICKCGKTGVDLEEYMCRWDGSPMVVARFKEKWRRARK